MHQLGRSGARWLALLLVVLLAACGGATDEGVTAVPSPQPAALATLAPSPVPPTFTPVPLPTPTATAVPSPTPRPSVALFVPNEWQDAAQRAVDTLNSAGDGWQWSLTDDVQAAVRLVNGSEGTVVHQEPLALTVPFTTEWEATDGETANDIVANGHPLVEVRPWRGMPPTQKALQVDGRLPGDEGYPFQTTWSLVGDADYTGGMNALQPILQAEMNAPLVHLAAVGDLMLARALGAALERGDLAYPFAKVADLLRTADITVGNLESALGDVGEPANKRYPFRAPPQAASALAQAGFDIVSLANNHAMDYGPDALLQALDLLQAQGVAPIGAGANAAAARAPHLVEVNGLTLAFLAYVNVPVEALSGFDTASWTATDSAPGMAWAAPETITTDVAATRSSADLIIVVLHSGYEYVQAPSPAQTDAARAAIDAGADLVIGHHAHILQGIEFYGEGVIVYGTGNFAFEIDGAPETAVFNIWLDADGVRQIEIVPAIIQFGGQPRLAESWEATPIRRTVYALTALLR